jgi:hypothetical protein
MPAQGLYPHVVTEEVGLLLVGEKDEKGEIPVKAVYARRPFSQESTGDQGG